MNRVTKLCDRSTIKSSELKGGAGIDLVMIFKTKWDINP